MRTSLAHTALRFVTGTLVAPLFGCEVCSILKDADDPQPAGHVLSLTTDDTPIVGTLKSEFGAEHAEKHGVSADDHRPLDSDHPAVESLENATALVAHGDDLLVGSDGPHPLIHAALEADVPIVLEEPSAELLAMITGVGMAADVAIITTSPPQTSADGELIPTVSVTLINHEIEAELSSAADDGTADVELSFDYELWPDDAIDGPAELESDPGAPDQPESTTDADAIAETVIAHLRALSPPAGGAAKAGHRAQAYPGHWQSSGVRAAGSKWVATVQVVNKSWRPAGDQSKTASVGLVFTASLFDSVAPDAKYCLIQVHGTGVQTSLLTNETWSRGYYNERFAFEMEPAGTALSIDKHAPLNSNHDTQIQVTTGLSVAASKEGPQVSYQSSESATLSYPDFEVLDESAARKARWVYQLYTVEGGHRYTSPADLIKTVSPQLRELPQYARGNIPIQCEATWFAAGDFEDVVTFNYTFRQSVASIWRLRYDVAPCVVTCPASLRFKTDQKNALVKGKFAIDFSRVSHIAAEANSNE